MTTTADRILKQVEFYFSDNNLPKDKFLKEELKANDGWVRINVLTTFNRVKALSADVDTIAAALRASKELLEVSEDNTRVRRKTELPEDLDLSPNSIYLKGFANDATLDDIEAYLATQGLQPKAIRMRYYKDQGEKKFKGSIFVELATPEEAKAALEKEYKMNDKTLLVMTKSAYLESKNEVGNRKRKAPEPKDKKEGESKEEGGDEEEGEEETKFTSGLLVSIKGLGEGATREVLKGWVEDKAGGRVAFIEYKIGDTDAQVRLAEDTPVKADGVVEKLTADDSVKTGDKKLTFAALTGDDETAAWKAIRASQASSKGKPKGKRPHKKQRRN